MRLSPRSVLEAALFSRIRAIGFPRRENIRARHRRRQPSESRLNGRNRTSRSCECGGVALISSGRVTALMRAPSRKANSFAISAFGGAFLRQSAHRRERPRKPESPFAIFQRRDRRRRLRFCCPRVTAALRVSNRRTEPDYRSPMAVVTRGGTEAARGAGCRMGGRASSVGSDLSENAAQPGRCKNLFPKSMFRVLR
jgi:hypothetical protein